MRSGSRRRGSQRKEKGLANFKFFYSKNFRIGLLAGSAALILGLIIYGIVWALTNKNALSITFADGKKIGVIPFIKTLTAEQLQAAAVLKLESEIGMKVRVNETVKLTPVHASKKEINSTADRIITEINNAFTYLVEATVFTVNGTEVGALRSVEEYEKVKSALIKPYIDAQPDANIVDSGFVEDVKPVKKFIDKSELTTVEKVITNLSAKKEVESSYLVVKGDTLSKIASKNGITIEALLKLNPDFNVNSTLKVGQEFRITTYAPVISVKTVEEDKQTQVYEKEVQTLENPNQYKTYKKVIQYGKNGEKEVTVHITRINGIEYGSEEISFVSKIDPVTEIIEVGTGQTPTTRKN